MRWLETSIMARKGVAGGAARTRHAIMIADQGAFHYVYGPYASPVLHVAPGAVVTVETHDAFEGKITRESDSPSQLLNFPFLNPQTGPIHVEGAEKGDALAVRIVSTTPRGPQPVGTTCLIPEFGGLVGTGSTAMLNAPLAEVVRKIRVDADGVHWSDTLTLPPGDVRGLCPPARRCHAHCLSRVSALGRAGTRVERDRRLHALDHVRQGPSGEHGRSEIQRRRLGRQALSEII